MTDLDMLQLIADEFKLRLIQVKNTIELLDSGNTVPFIARYRKEATGSLDENQIRDMQERIGYLRALEARKQTILTSIEEQGKLTPELREKIEKTFKLHELEDLYLPYKPRKRTRATMAREKGLEPLAEMILKQETVEGSALEYAAAFINAEKEVHSAEEALQGAMDIVAEVISDDAEVRKAIREKTFAGGVLKSEGKGAEGRTAYEMYYDFSEAVKTIPPHRVLAINRGESETALRVNVEVNTETMQEIIETLYVRNRRSVFTEYLLTAIRDSYRRLIEPSISREVRSDLTEKADEHAITIFAANLKNLLLQPPVRNKMIMGIDPGFRTGCKVAVIDYTGKYLEGQTIYPHPPQAKWMEAKNIVRRLVEKHGVEIIAIGNGTASRETEQLAAELIGEMGADRKLAYIIVSEAGASVYSASKVAQEEFPELEASLRGNISIARRLQEPLAELVKIDPKSIGVGLYQHDVNQKRLAQALQNVVESAVNMVGVNLNTSSASLLRYVSGLTSRTADSIVKYRDEHGAFHNREELKNVSGIGEIAFQQAAGFLRITGGNNALDNTSIHPESYQAAEKLLHQFQINDVNLGGRLLRRKIKESNIRINELLQELGVGEPTFKDILDNLEKPGLDPRDDMPKPLFKSDVLKMEDLSVGMTLKGTVRNVVDFGAFVDIGVKQDGLIHVSQMRKKYVKNPLEVIRVGDIVDVKVVSIDLERGRIGLSMIMDSPGGQP
jgi:uncharacterized protein